MNRKLYIIILITFLYSCSKNTSNNINTIEDKKENEKSEIQTEANNDHLALKCKNFEQKVLMKNIDWIHVNKDLINCLLNTGFQGDEGSNRQLSELIKLSKTEHLSLFGNNPKFRGSLIFETLINKEKNYLPVANDDGINMGFMTSSDALSPHIFNMINTINGVGVQSYLAQLYSNHKFKYSRYNEDGSRNFQLTRELSVLKFNSIKKEYYNNNIILKKFNEI